jgi:hypothetical protein
MHAGAEKKSDKSKIFEYKMLKTSERQLVFCKRLQSSFSSIRFSPGT